MNRIKLIGTDILYFFEQIRENLSTISLVDPFNRSNPRSIF